ncbi:MAG: ACP S-malonyltransferase [Bacteroidetes bacterium]|nr:ACP S-malonyltransferase [Bacteroidota bacterium]MCH8246950.1 ACP S-malonyltransferase [Bacteroidota bacterium]
MTKTAFIFPGQGSQFIGMGLELYDAFPEAREVFDRADALLGFSLTEIMFGSGGEIYEEIETLKKTEFTQPALFTHSAAAMRVLESSDDRPDMTAGHSLGEYSALVAAGAIDFEEGLRIVRQRGLLMGKAGSRRAGTMAAVLGLDDSVVDHVCNRATSSDQVVVVANYNSVGQVVISGDVEAVERATILAKEAGARKAVILPVSGAFHSPLMEHAREGLEEVLMGLEIQPPTCPVYLNVTAQPATEAEEIRTRLIEQLTAPVRWSHTLTAMEEAGAGRFLEVGTGRVLTGLVRRTLGRETETAHAGTSADMQKILEAASISES